MKTYTDYICTLHANTSLERSTLISLIQAGCRTMDTINGIIAFLDHKGILVTINHNVDHKGITNPEWEFAVETEDSLYVSAGYVYTNADTNKLYPSRQKAYEAGINHAVQHHLS